jgi:Glycosyl hydrolases family 2, TIM barrel domain
MKLSYKNVVAMFMFSLSISTTMQAGNDRPTVRSQIVVNKGTLSLASPGKKGPVDYSKYGDFTGLGTKDYKYVIRDKAGLAAAVGEGIFPNIKVSSDPRFRELLKNNQLQGNHWRFVDIPNAELGFYKWATTNEEPGVRQFYSAIQLERAGLLEEAIKAYYALLVHFPKTISYTYYKTPWYVGPSTMDRLVQLLRRNPQIKMDYQPGHIQVVNKFDNDIKNDSFVVDPGKLVAVKKRKEPKPVDLSKLDVVKTIGGPKVQLKQFSNRHWQFLVDGKPFPIKAVTYSVTPVGASPDRGTWNPSRGWQEVDSDKNGIHDGFFESYVDKNNNNKKDNDEPAVGDATLLKELGANSLRAYHHLYDKELMRRLYKDYGLYVICGDLLGGYAVGSGATWADGTDYNNPVQRAAMLESVRKMVTEFKDEPYILMWMLGNENIYGVANNSPQYPDAFYSLTNEAAKLIHELDPTRPVGIANGDLLHLDLIKKNCPDVDVLGANVYRGEQGFGRHLFMDVQELMDRPVLITEYGASAYAENYSTAEATAYQAMYLANNWEDLEANMAGRGVGNALGGVLFEFMDEWWKANSDLPESVQKERPDWYAQRSATYKSLQPQNQEIVPQFGFPFLDGWSYEEWYGLIAQGDGSCSPFCRQLRPSYSMIKRMWTSK